LRNAHDRFEVLIGALALGEATPAEQAELERHAAVCASCREDSALAPRLLSVVEGARSAEMWRPASDDRILARIHNSRANRFRVTVAALGWVVALSIVFDVAFTTGIGPRLYDALHPTGPATVAAGEFVSTASLPAPKALQRSPSVVAPKLRAAPGLHRVSALVVAVKHHAVPARSPAVTSEIPDVLAGLELDGKRTSARSVAALSTNSQP